MADGMLVWFFSAVAIGIGATVAMDLWGLLQRRIFGVPFFNYGLVGRWVGHMPQGRFAHPSIGQAAPVPGEGALGWGVHYAVGIVYAGIVLAVWTLDWARNPTLLPALIVGIGTIVVPFFIMQPGLGLGVAAAKTPKPWLARLRSLVNHTSFAIGLYLAARLILPVL